MTSLGVTSALSLSKQCDVDATVLDNAKNKKEQAILALALGKSRVAEIILNRCYYHIPTTAAPFDTAAVTAFGDGTLALVYNPKFIDSMSVDDAMFIFYHEALHLFFLHLRVEPELRKDQTYTLANEVTINHVALTRLGRKDMPHTVVRDEHGNPVLDSSGKAKTEPTGVDPRKVHKDYVKDLTEQGLEAVPYEKFVESDFMCYSEMKRMKNPPGASKKYKICMHQDPNANGDQTGSGPGSGLPQDQETIDRAVQEALQQAVTEALKGNSATRDELLQLGEATESTSDRASKIWGDLGLGALRGETLATRRVEWWQRWLRGVLGSKLTHGGKLVYPKKRAGILASLGFDSPLLHRGPERQKEIVIAIDTSGSMSHEVIEKLTKLVGQIHNTTAHWLSFDGAVMPFKPGERVKGGGGTSFQVVADYVEGRLAVNGSTFKGKADAIIVVTDGYAPHIAPQEPDKWVWLVTEGGDMWMDTSTPKMACHTIDVTEAAKTV